MGESAREIERRGREGEMHIARGRKRKDKRKKCFI